MPGQLGRIMGTGWRGSRAAWKIRAWSWTSGSPGSAVLEPCSTRVVSGQVFSGVSVEMGEAGIGRASRALGAGRDRR